MMAHKLPKGIKPIFVTGGSFLRARPFFPTTTEPQARRTLDQPERACKCHSWWSPFLTHQIGSDHFANVVRYPRENIDLVPATSGPISYQWQRGRGFHAITPFSNTASLTSKTGQWEGLQVLEEDCLPQKSVLITAGTSLLDHRRQTGQWEGVQGLDEDCLPQKSVPRKAGTSLFAQLSPVNPLSAATSSSLRNRPHRRRRNTSAMPRCGYDTTNMRVAANPRPAASAGASSHSRNDKSKNDGNRDGGNGSGSGASGRGEDDGRDDDDDDKGSKKTPEKAPGRGGKDGAWTTEELIKTIDDVRLPMEGRGWTFWL